MSPSPPEPGPDAARPGPATGPAAAHAPTRGPGGVDAASTADAAPVSRSAVAATSGLPGPADAALPGDEGRRRLSERAVPYWRIQLALYAVPAAAIVTVLAVVLDVSSTLSTAAIVAAWVIAVAVVAVVPPVRRGIWWYAIGEEEVDLREGLLVITRTVVPMVRVQHVDLHRGPISTRLGLAEIELHTAAGSVTIPALDRDEAERIRRQVSVLARVPDDL
jgi:membrane protein YdbS with pleckstrin-like domain